jgi:hypothetical protein
MMLFGGNAAGGWIGVAPRIVTDNHDAAFAMAEFL